MSPPADPTLGPRRRLPLYVAASLGVVLSGLLVVFLLARKGGEAGGSGTTQIAATGKDPFVDAMNAGCNYLDNGESVRSVEAFSRAVAANPAHPDARLNLAMALLRAGRPAEAVTHAEEVLKIDYRSAAAHYVLGCARLRLGQQDAALKSLQTAHDMEPSVAAASFQLGRAHMAVGNLDEAVFSFQETTIRDPKHPAAYYLLSQALLRADRRDEAAIALQTHQQLAEGKAGFGTNAEELELCKHTTARRAFTQEQPDVSGIPVAFADDTDRVLPGTGGLAGPVAVLDAGYDDWQDLVVVRGGELALLRNRSGVLQVDSGASGIKLSARPTRFLVGDLHNDRVEDVVAVGLDGAQVFRFATNGTVTDVTAQSGLSMSKAANALLADLDVTGKLDFLAVARGAASARFYRNQGNSIYADMTAFAGLPDGLDRASNVIAEDWNNDDLLDLIFVRPGDRPLLVTKQRGGLWTSAGSPPDWPVGDALAAGDLNNDGRSDLVVASPSSLTMVLAGSTNQTTLPLNNFEARVIVLLDYDNDGWLDVFAGGSGVRVWRNLGNAGFQERTKVLGLESLKFGSGSRLMGIHPADFDMDCDTDVLLDMGAGGLRFLRNNGGNAQRQLKLRVIGQRSNASGLGIRIDAAAGGLKVSRTVSRLPIEIGVGRHELLQSLNVRWFDLSINSTDVKVDCARSLYVSEIQLPTGSCPYLYVCDGDETRFVTDLLGAAPLGLPVAEGRLIDADPDEIVWMGGESDFKPRDGFHQLHITEELREVLYLDTAALIAVDHPPGTEIHSTSKLRPGKPFDHHELVVLEPAHALLSATGPDGRDVTEILAGEDRRRLSPPAIRSPQLRGLAEPFAVILDFGALATNEPLVLLLNGWLRFGGGMANMGASHDTSLPFPFPMLEAESMDGTWQPLDVVVGAPAGKTKTILADLSGKLPPGARRLRLSTAFEIHWDRIALMRRTSFEMPLHEILPDVADLHWRGFSEFEDRPWHEPLTPDYRRVQSQPNWVITPSGWCTRYGDVRELLEQKDNALVLINGGDELTLKFDASRIPMRTPGMQRSFFLRTSGWDKDADYHVRHGWTVEPLPFHGMDDQSYGKQVHPAGPNAPWIKKYNTRWVGPRTFSRSGN